jgi:hypothetical protein
MSCGIRERYAIADPMSEPIKHHYLPVFYLRRWTGSDGRLFRYYRPHKEVVVSPVSPEHTGFEKGLYALDGAARAQMIETDFFSPVDNAAAPILEHLINRGPGDLSGEQRGLWTRFVMSLQLRNPHSITEIRSVIDPIVRANIEQLDGQAYLQQRQEGEPESVYEYALQQAPHQLANAHKAFLPGLIDHEFIGGLIINMSWAVLNLSAASHTLLTGDRPYSTSHGLGNRACLLGVPLSPTHLFVAANEIEQIRKLLAQTTKDTVRNTNNLTVKLAVQNVYGSTARHKAFVENRLRRENEPPVPGIITRDQATTQTPP